MSALISLLYLAAKFPSAVKGIEIQSIYHTIRFRRVKRSRERPFPRISNSRARINLHILNATLTFRTTFHPTMRCLLDKTGGRLAQVIKLYMKLEKICKRYAKRETLIRYYAVSSQDSAMPHVFRISRKAFVRQRDGLRRIVCSCICRIRSHVPNTLSDGYTVYACEG